MAVEAEDDLFEEVPFLIGDQGVVGAFGSGTFVIGDESGEFVPEAAEDGPHIGFGTGFGGGVGKLDGEFLHGVFPFRLVVVVVLIL